MKIQSSQLLVLVVILLLTSCVSGISDAELASGQEQVHAGASSAAMGLPLGKNFKLIKTGYIDNYDAEHSTEAVPICYYGWANVVLGSTLTDSDALDNYYQAIVDWEN